jgi:hypothetical protein
MGKDITKNLVGQPIFKQIINIIPKEKFEELVLKSGSDKYYKTFFFVGTDGRHVVWDILTMRFNKRHKNADLVYIDSLFVVDSDSDFVRKQKGIFNDSRVAQDTFDKSFVFDLGSNRSAASV